MKDLTGIVVDGRSCDGCAMCCKVFLVPSLDKPAGVWCQHCKSDLLCDIYEERPLECSSFFCHYRRDADLPEYWKPSQSHMVVVTDLGGLRIMVHVDPQSPQSWRKQPYYQDLKKWALNRIQADKQVHVRIGLRSIVILPDRDVDLGVVGDRMIMTNKIQTPQGPSLAIQLVDKDDPRVKAAKAQSAQPPNPFRR